mmetsp:Transcript_1887/g.11375  ORF Transcript_1887/g.11375 Transcript_1887/m.11375 type:complete len:144 (+) Transcript_1887:2832-3263(+)
MGTVPATNALGVRHARRHSPSSWPQEAVVDASQLHIATCVDVVDERHGQERRRVREEGGTEVEDGHVRVRTRRVIAALERVGNPHERTVWVPWKRWRSGEDGDAEVVCYGSSSSSPAVSSPPSRAGRGKKQTARGKTIHLSST